MKTAHYPLISRIHCRATLVCLALAILAAELLFVSQSLDAFTLSKNEALGAWQKSFAYFGSAAKLFVLAVFVFAVIRKQALITDWQRLLEALSIKRYLTLLPAQLGAYAALLYLSWLIFAAPQRAHELPDGVFVAWVVAAVATAGLWLLGLAPSARLRRYVVREKHALLLAACTSVVTFYLAVSVQGNWTVLAENTFVVASWLLSGYGELLYVDVATKRLGLGDFVVAIAPACSGYEGIGLITAFTAVYLYLYRADFRFPLALLLFPLGAIAIWLLNCVRIALLVVIGHHWSPEVAIGGFHSQAGWITFILTSVALLSLAQNSRWLTRATVVHGPAAVSRLPNLPVATLLPLIALLAATLLTSALASGFDYLYPLRVLVVGAVICKVWRQLELRPFKPRWESAIAAIAVAGLWVAMLGNNPEQNAIFQAGLDGMSGYTAWAWLAFRVVGAVITVPIAEELAFRAYLLCRLSRREVSVVGPLPATIVAVVLSSLAFGALHGAWLAGTVAGLAYAWVRLRSNHIGDAVLAHAGTNAVLFVYAAISGQWWLL